MPLTELVQPRHDKNCAIGRPVGLVTCPNCRVEMPCISLQPSEDPGIALTLPSGQQRQLLLLNRFIEPDIAVEDASSTLTERLPQPEVSEDRQIAPGTLNALSTQRASATRAPMTAAVRRPLANWLTEVEQAAIIAPAGYGKNSFLRALALDLLSDGKLFPDLTKRVGRPYSDRSPLRAMDPPDLPRSGRYLLVRRHPHLVC
jgi:hypothetical protein